MIRQYHGHLSGIYSLALHPTLDVLVTGGRDSVARVWDMRTKVQVTSAERDTLLRALRIAKTRKTCFYFGATGSVVDECFSIALAWPMIDSSQQRAAPCG